jgi:hypothetical protein
MPNQLLSCGVPYTLVTNQVYALPAVKTYLFCGDATPTLEQSNVQDFSTKATLTLTGGVSQVTGLFIRATAGTPIIALSRD